jgi:catechol 2,3-dioxygenase-like lactoylglutathione lyase family enzyme
MDIELNHTVVPARDKVASARFFARIMGLTFDPNETGYFTPVRVNSSFTMDFTDIAQWSSTSGASKKPPIHHYGFKVSEEEFDSIFARIVAEGITYGSGPPNPFDDMRINRRGGGRGAYFRDPDGHFLELLTME